LGLGRRKWETDDNSIIRCFRICTVQWIQKMEHWACSKHDWFKRSVRLGKRDGRN